MLFEAETIVEYLGADGRPDAPDRIEYRLCDGWRLEARFGRAWIATDPATVLGHLLHCEDLFSRFIGPGRCLPDDFREKLGLDLGEVRQALSAIRARFPEVEARR